MTPAELKEVDLQLHQTADLINAEMMLDDYLFTTKVLFGSCSALIASHSGNAIKSRMRDFGRVLFDLKEAKTFEENQPLKDECRYVAIKFSEMLANGQIIGRDVEAAFAQANKFFKT